MENNTLAFVKFCGKLDDSYPGCQRNFFARSERTLSDSKSTVEDTRLITSQVCMSSSNASSCIILLVLATVNFLDMGCLSAPRLFKNLTETSELATKFFFVLGNYRSNLVLMDERVFTFENKFGWPLLLKTVTRSYNVDRIKSSTGFLAADEL